MSLIANKSGLVLRNPAVWFGRLFFLGLLAGCDMDPEATLRAYQAAIDRNDFRAAATLSTAAERARLEDIATIMAMDISDSTRLHTAFIELECAERGDTARCACLLEDEYERYWADFVLVRNARSQWLVDAPADSAIFIDPMLENAIDSLLNALDQ